MILGVPGDGDSIRGVNFVLRVDDALGQVGVVALVPIGDGPDIRGSDVVHFCRVNLAVVGKEPLMQPCPVGSVLRNRHAGDEEVGFDGSGYFCDIAPSGAVRGEPGPEGVYPVPGDLSCGVAVEDVVGIEWLEEPAATGRHFRCRFSVKVSWMQSLGKDWGEKKRQRAESVVGKQEDDEKKKREEGK